MMRKRILTIASVVAAAAAFPAVAGATTTTNPANAPNGTHFKSGTASCSDSVTCSGFTLAGVGNTNVEANLSAKYSATVVCINGGGNPSDSQHQGSFTQATT